LDKDKRLPTQPQQLLFSSRLRTACWQSIPVNNRFKLLATENADISQPTESLEWSLLQHWKTALFQSFVSIAWNQARPFAGVLPGGCPGTRQRK
jgi:hypothetical protein